MGVTTGNLYPRLELEQLEIQSPQRVQEIPDAPPRYLRLESIIATGPAAFIHLQQSSEFHPPRRNTTQQIGNDTHRTKAVQ